MNDYPKAEITGAVLAGGQARRMGGTDKGLVELNGLPMVEYILKALAPQVGSIIINANRNHDVYSRFEYPVVSDSLENYQGPLAGMASVMQHAQTPLILTVPCDGPLIPADLAQRLYFAMSEQNSDISIAFDGQRMQPVYSLLKVSLLDSLLRFLDEGERKIDLWYERHKHALADFSDAQDTFLNINTPQERDSLSARLGEPV